VNPSENAPRPADSLRLGALNLDEIQALSRAPRTLRSSPRAAPSVGVYEKTTFPARTEELWRRTDITSFKWDQVRPAASRIPW